MFCVHCGRENDREIEFCTACEEQLKATQATAKKKRRLIVGGLAGLMIAIGASGYGYLHSLDSSEKIALLPSALVDSIVANAEGTEKDKTEIIKTAQKGVFTIYTDDGMGSGFLYGDGTVATNAHVVAGFTEVKVRDHNGKDKPGQVIGISEFFDVALIQVDGYKGKKPLPIGSQKMKLGSEVIAMGSPQGLENSASIGYLTGLDRTLPDGDYYYGEVYQIDAQIYPGSSGGPLLDAKTGEVIGINSGALYDDDTIAFAVPIEEMVELLDKWTNAPLTKEEVALVAPPSEGLAFDDDVAVEGKFEIPKLTNFIQYFRSSYEMAMEEADMYYIDPMLDYTGEAYKKFEGLIDSQGSEDFPKTSELISHEVTNVDIQDGYAIVSTSEKYNSLNDKGERTPYTKDKDYTIVLNEYGYYVISKISTYE